MTAHTAPITYEPEATVLVQPALPDELDLVRELAGAVGLYTSSATSQGSTYWIARRAGEAVGCIGMEHGISASLLRSLAVLPEARGLGVGRALAQSALTLASLRGDRAVYLFSSEAGAYWGRLGFAAVPVTELEAALPVVPQVVSGLTRGWIHAEQAWKKDLPQ